MTNFYLARIYRSVFNPSDYIFSQKIFFDDSFPRSYIPASFRARWHYSGEEFQAIDRVSTTRVKSLAANHLGPLPYMPTRRFELFTEEEFGMLFKALAQEALDGNFTGMKLSFTKLEFIRAYLN